MASYCSNLKIVIAYKTFINVRRLWKWESWRRKRWWCWPLPMDKQKEFSHRTQEPQTKLSVNTDESFFIKSKLHFPFLCGKPFFHSTRAAFSFRFVFFFLAIRWNRKGRTKTYLNLYLKSVIRRGKRKRNIPFTVRVNFPFFSLIHSPLRSRVFGGAFVCRRSHYCLDSKREKNYDQEMRIVMVIQFIIIPERAHQYTAMWIRGIRGV